MNTKLISRALIFALCLVLPNLVVLLVSHGTSWRMFDDWDEPFYFPLAYDLLNVGLSEVSRADKLLPHVFFGLGGTVPHYLSVAVLGRIIHLLHLNIQWIACALDFICIFLSYVLFANFYRLIVGEATVGEAAAALTLFCPWLYPLTAKLSPIVWNDVSLHGLSGYVCLPILRGPFTQLSYVPLALALLLAAQALSTRNRGLTWALVGISAGSAIYCYFFAWAAVSLLLGLTIVIHAFSGREDGIPMSQRIAPLVLFVCSNLFIAAYALFWIFGRVTQTEFALTERGPWYFPLEAFILLALLSRCRHCKTKQLNLCFLVGAVAAEIILGNSQKLSSRLVTEYHFLNFYLYPLATGLLANLFLTSKVGRLAKDNLLIFIFAILILTCGLRTERKWSAVHQPEDRDFQALIKKTEEMLPSDSNLLVNGVIEPFANHWNPVETPRLMPYWIRSLSNRYPFIRTKAGENPDEAQKELLSGLLYSGNVQNVGACPSKQELDQQERHSFWNYFTERRRNLCEALHSEMKTATACSLLRQNKIEYVLWEKELPFSPVPPLNEFLSPVWESPNGFYKILHLDQMTAEDSLC